MNQTPVVAAIKLPAGRSVAASGWWLHCSRVGVTAELVDSAVVETAQHGTALAVHVRLLAPQRGYASVTLRACRPILAAERITPLDRPLAGGPTQLAIRELGSPIDTDAEKVAVPIGRHEAVHLVLLLQLDPSPRQSQRDAAGDIR